MRIATLLTACIIFFSDANAQTQTVGLFINKDSSYNGYTLFAPMAYTSTYLIDNDGQLVHEWQSDGNPGLSVQLKPNGNLLRTEVVNNQILFAGGGGGKVIELDWEGNVVWQFVHSSDKYRLHHDIEYLPNGNVLMISWEYKTFDEAVAAGRNPNRISQNALWPDKIIEVKPINKDSSEIVWEWHLWDHMVQQYDITKDNYGVISEHPELISLNYFEQNSPQVSIADFVHINSVDYNEQYDQILLSAKNYCEIWIIDHGTTTAEAASHSGGKYGKGGDLLYRWGNLYAYGMGTLADKKLFDQHNAQWVEENLPGAGNITIFNNGYRRDAGKFSSVEEITPPVDSAGNYTLNESGVFGPDETSWTYNITGTEHVYSMNLSSVQRLPNGNTLICVGPFGEFIEVTPAEEIAWFYICPVGENGPLTQGEEIISGVNGSENRTFNTVRFPADYSAFDGKDLSPKGKIELDPTGISQNENSPVEFILYQNYPNPFNPSTTIKFGIPTSPFLPPLTKGRDEVGLFVTLKIYDILGNKVAALVNETKAPGSYEVNFDATALSSGMYFYKLTAGEFVGSRKMLLIK